MSDSVVVTALESQSTGHEFDSHPLYCWIWHWASRSRTCCLCQQVV